MPSRDFEEKQYFWYFGGFLAKFRLCGQVERGKLIALPHPPHPNPYPFTRGRVNADDERLIALLKTYQSLALRSATH